MFYVSELLASELHRVEENSVQHDCVICPEGAEHPEEAKSAQDGETEHD